MTFTELLGVTGFYAFVTAIWYVLTWFGWRRLARWRTQLAPSGKAFSWGTATIGLESFRPGINLWLNNDGMWLKPVFLYSLFHPPLFIPWSDIEQLSQPKDSLFNETIVKLKNNNTRVSLWLALGHEVYKFWQQRNAQQPSSLG